MAVKNVFVLSAVQTENTKQLALIADKNKLELDKWKQKRNDAFDKNRNLEDTIRERDGLRHMTVTLQRVLSQLVEYFNLCEDELNNTFVGELVKQILEADDAIDNTFIFSSFTATHEHESHDGSIHGSRENLDISTVSHISGKHSNTKRMHFAPKVDGIMPFIETDHILDCLDKSDDISVNFKLDLDSCLNRLRYEAQELLLLSQGQKRKSILGPVDEQKPTKDYADVNELLQEFSDLQNKYEACETIKKDLEESLAQSLYREAMLKEELQETNDKMNELANYHSVHTRDIIEGPMSPPTRLAAELQAATSEREDMQMQLEAANKQLRSTRQFLEEQATEREHERDEYQHELKQLKEDNSKLVIKNQQFVRISKEVEQLETQIRDMTNKIGDLESEVSLKQTELASSEDKILLLRDTISELESQLETKSMQEIEVLKDLETYQLLAEEREIKIKDLCQELTVMKNDIAAKVTEDLLGRNNKNYQNSGNESEMDAEKQLVEQMRSELQTFAKILAEHTASLESLHEAVCSQSCSSPSEDVSIRDHKKINSKDEPPDDVLRGRLPVLEVWQLGDGLQRHLRAEDAALKRIRDLEMQLVQLKDVAQELRMERDILQERMSEQSLKISSLQSRLDQTRHTVEAQSYLSTEGLRRQLDQALAEVQLLRESLDCKDKQLKAYEGTPSPETSKEMMHRLKRDLEEHKYKCRELQKAFDEYRLEQDSILADKNADIDVLRQQLLEKEKHLQAILSLRIEDEKEKDMINDGKLSARTLSDILSISEFDDPDQIIRNAEPAQSFLSGQFAFPLNDNKDITTLPEANKKFTVASSDLAMNNIENTPNSFKDMNSTRPKEITLPKLHSLHEDASNIEKNVSSKHDRHTQSNNLISDNCSMFPNKDVSGDKNNSIQPKKIDFSLYNVCEDNDKQKKYISPFKRQNLSLIEPLYEIEENQSKKHHTNCKSLDDLGIYMDYQQKKYPDVLTQLKHEINLLKEELISKTSALKMAEEQLSEFPLVKSDMDELERMLQNSLETMQEDKKYYNSQLENFVIGEKILKDKLEQALKEVNEKSEEIQILKEDIVRRETIVSEIYKEKKNLESQLSKLEERCRLLENNSSENQRLKAKLNELQKLEQMIAEKNLQIDNLNENLDRLDDLQKKIADQENQNEKLNMSLLVKMTEISDLQLEMHNLKCQGERLQGENINLISEKKKLTNYNDSLQSSLMKFKETFMLLEKDLENVVEKPSPRNMNSYDGIDINNTELVQLEEYKQLLSGLDEPKKSNNSIQNESLSDRQRQVILEKIRVKIASLQSDLHSKRKELNIKAFQLEKSKLEIDELKSQVEFFSNDACEKEEILEKLMIERDNLRSGVNQQMNRLREEGNLEELQNKVTRKAEECQEIHGEVHSLKMALENSRNQMNMPNSGRKENLQEINDRLRDDVESLKTVLAEREDHITQLLMTQQALQHQNMIKDTQVGRLQSVLEAEQQTSSSLQAQDTNVIKLLKDRLENVLSSESNLQMELEREKAITDQLQKQIDSLKKQLELLNNELKSVKGSGLISQEKFEHINAKFEDQVEITNSLRSEIMMLTTQLETEKGRIIDLQYILDTEKQNYQKEMILKKEQESVVADFQQKTHELHLELVGLRETLHLQKNNNSSLEKKLLKLQDSQRKTENVETYETLLEMETLLRRNINENIQMSETVRELTHERRELQAKVKQLETQIKLGAKHSISMATLPEGVDQQVHFLYGRYMRVDSYRKALVWQKRYLVKVAAAVSLAQSWKTNSTTSQRFKCVVFAIIAINRMKYMVKRWHTGNRLGANIHLNIPNVYPTELRNSKSYSHLPTFTSSMREKFENRSRQSLSNPRGTARASNMSWTGSVISNLNVVSQGDRWSDCSGSKHLTTLPESSILHKPKSTMQAFQEPERCHNEFRSNDMETESEEPKDIIYLGTNLENNSAPSITRYKTQMHNLDTKSQRTLYTPKNPH